MLSSDSRPVTKLFAKPRLVESNSKSTEPTVIRLFGFSATSTVWSVGSSKRTPAMASLGSSLSESINILEEASPESLRMSSAWSSNVPVESCCDTSEFCTPTNPRFSSVGGGKVVTAGLSGIAGALSGTAFSGTTGSGAVVVSGKFGSTGSGINGSGKTVAVSTKSEFAWSGNSGAIGSVTGGRILEEASPESNAGSIGCEAEFCIPAKPSLSSVGNGDATGVTNSGVAASGKVVSSDMTEFSGTVKGVGVSGMMFSGKAVGAVGNSVITVSAESTGSGATTVAGES